MVPLSQQNSQNRREIVKFSGVFIAPVTPVDSSGRVALPLWNDLIGFLLDAGVDGLCVGGATSEYVHFTQGERTELMHCAAAGLKGRGKLFASIGASTYRQVLELGEQAVEEGADAALVPMPHFFRYQQVDLEHFCREVSQNLPLPCLLYNLPVFTNPLEIETTIRLLQEAPGIVGIKDSSGDSEALTRYPEACRDARDATSLMVGKDIRIFDGLSSGWDGCVSGLGNLCPELVVEL
jgi:4-hydroxy-tetrahydrodipicolinate synthase